MIVCLTSIYCRAVYVGATNETFEAVEAAMERAISDHPNHPAFTSCSHPTESYMRRRIEKGAADEEEHETDGLQEEEEELEAIPSLIR